MYEPSDVFPNGMNAFSTSQLDNYTRFREKSLIDADISALISLSNLLYNTLLIADDKEKTDEDIDAAKYAAKELKRLSLQIQDDYDMIQCLEGFRYIEMAVGNINRMKDKYSAHGVKLR